MPVPRRYFSAITIWLAMAMSVLDGAIANVALPTIATELDVSLASSIWVVNAYQLAITITLLPLAALGDTIGYRRVYIGGITLFTLGSLCCALSHTLPTLVAARVLQGLGAAGLMSINSALVRFTYPKKELGRGIGMNAVVISMAAALGPTVASAILSRGSWEWLFAINVPIGVLVVAIAGKTLPETPGSKHPFDVLSAVLNAATFGGLVLGIENLARGSNDFALPQLIIAALAGFFLVRRELNRVNPLVPFDLMRIPLFGLSAATSVVSFAAQMLAYVALPFAFQNVFGHSAVETGLLMTPWPLGVAITAPLAGRLADRFPAGLLGAIGLFVFGTGLFCLSRLTPEAAVLDIVWRMALCGLGFGFFQSPNNRAMVGSAPLNRSGAAGGMLATARLLGQTSGAVTMAVLFHGVGPRATTVALQSAAVVAVVAAAVSLTRLRIPVVVTPETP